MALFWRKRWHKRTRRTQVAKKSTARRIFFGAAIVFLIALTFTGIWYGARAYSVTIANIDIRGGETVSHDVVRGVVEQELLGSYLLLIPKRFIFTFPKESIVESVNDIVRVHNVRVTKESNTHISVVFEEYTPHALACDADQDSGTCYFIDATGYVFSPAPPLRGGAFTRHILEGVELSSEMQAIDQVLLVTIDELLKVFGETFKFRATHVHHSDVGDVTYFINGGGKILTTNSMSSQETFDNLQSVLDSEEFSHIVPGNFNYIDLRFGNKVFVNEELEIDKEDLATSTEAEVL